MTQETIVTILCGLAILVGIAGTILPVLPGGILIAAALLAWAIWGGAGAVGWVVFAIGVVFVAVGMAASALLTGRKMKQHAIPGRSVVIGLAAGVVGMFVIPVVGLLVGFAGGLLLSELARTRNPGTAATTSWAAIKATGLGILVEFGLACLAASTWLIGLYVASAT